MAGPQDFQRNPGAWGISANPGGGFIYYNPTTGQSFTAPVDYSSQIASSGPVTSSLPPSPGPSSIANVPGSNTPTASGPNYMWTGQFPYVPQVASNYGSDIPSSYTGGTQLGVNPSFAQYMAPNFGGNPQADYGPGAGPFDTGGGPIVQVGSTGGTVGQTPVDVPTATPQTPSLEVSGGSSPTGPMPYSPASTAFNYYTDPSTGATYVYDQNWQYISTMQPGQIIPQAPQASQGPSMMAQSPATPAAVPLPADLNTPAAIAQRQALLSGGTPVGITPGAPFSGGNIGPNFGYGAGFSNTGGFGGGGQFATPYMHGGVDPFGGGTGGMLSIGVGSKQLAAGSPTGEASAFMKHGQDIQGIGSGALAKAKNPFGKDYGGGASSFQQKPNPYNWWDTAMLAINSPRPSSMQPASPASARG